MPMFGINRYIMECKFKGVRKKVYPADGELIDTLWNVNVIKHS